MDKTKRKKALSLQAIRTTKIQSRLQKKTVPKTVVKSSRTKSYASLEHMLNATALYRLGEYARASLAFQRAMAADDSNDMLESLEDANAQLGNDDDEEVIVEDSKEECEVEVDTDEDYLREDFESTDEDDSEDELELTKGSELDLELLDEEESSDVLDTEDEDLSVDEFSVEARSKKNRLALK